MDTLTREDLANLLRTPSEVCISIYMPTYRVGKETAQGPIRLKNLLRQADASLCDRGLRTPQVRAFLEPAQALLVDGLFWQHQSDGLALFLASTGLRSYRLPLHFEDLAVIGERFHIKPLLSLFAADGRFFILAISQNEVRLIECTRYSFDEVDLSSVPASLAEALRFDDAEKQLQYHTSTMSPGGKGGERPAIFHGQGGGVDDAKTNLLRYFQEIDKGLRELLQDDQAPLVLAGVGYLLPIYREANDYPHLAEHGIEGNPEELSDEALHRQAWEIVQPLFTHAQQEALVEYQRLSNLKSAAASNDLDKILPAAYAGRVETLLVAASVQRWGTFDPPSGTVELHEDARAGDEDLLDLAAVRTLQHGGIVYALETKSMPDSSVSAAIFRY